MKLQRISMALSLLLLAAVQPGLAAPFPYLGDAPTPGALYNGALHLDVRHNTESIAASGLGPIGNTTTELEPELAAMGLNACDAIGTVIGAIRFTNGDILTYGSAGTLRLAADNSGSITFNDGEILTFSQANPAVRTLALTSTLLF